MSKSTKQNELARRAAQGDVSAFREIYGAFRGPVEGQLRRMLGPAADVESARQEVFVEIHRSLAHFRGKASLSTWIFGVTRNVGLRVLRKRRDAAPLGADLENSRALPRLEARDLLRRLYQALDTLPEAQRDAFVLHEIEGRTLAEIAELTGAPIGTVTTRIRRGRAVLAARFRAELEPAVMKVAERAS